MRRWALGLAAASVVVAGCGGGGGHSGGGTTPPTNTTDSYVKLTKVPGVVNFAFLTGAGRDIGDETAIIRRLVLTDTNGALVETQLQADIALQLNGYTHNVIKVDAQTTNSRFFTSYTLEVKELRVDNGSAFPDVFPSSGSDPLAQVDFPTSIRVLPGRHTAVQVRLDDTMFDTSADPIFQQSIFEAANLADNPVQGIPTLNGFLSDYVTFDISNMASSDRPQMSDGSAAGKVYFSGDFVAESQAGTSGTFEVLTTLGFIGGQFSGVVSLPGADSTIPFSTYLLNQADPRDVDPSDGTFPGDTVHQITALQGNLYALSDAVGNLSSFEVITFPRSQERLVHDTRTNTDVLRELSTQDVVLVKRNGSGAITNMYFGEIDFGANQGDTPTLRAYPIGQIDDGDAHNEIVGTVSGFKDVSGTAVSLNVADSLRAETIQKIGSGTFTLSNSTDPVYGGTVPADFPTTGRFLVFRK